HTRFSRDWSSDVCSSDLQAPEKDGLTLPTEAELLAVFDAVRAKDIAPYEDVVADAPLVATPPAPGTITGETRHDAVGVVEWSLSDRKSTRLNSSHVKISY